MNKMVCELCGSNDIIKKDGFFVCQYCNTKYSLDEENSLLDGIEVAVTSPIKIINNDYEEKLAKARNFVYLYFSRGPKYINYKGRVGYDAITLMFNEAEQTGGNGDYRYFLEYSDFYVKANIEGAKVGYRVIQDCDEFIATYKRLMDLAIINAPEGEKDRLEEEKEERAEKVRREISTLPARRIKSPNNSSFIIHMGIAFGISTVALLFLVKTMNITGKTAVYLWLGMWALGTIILRIAKK